MALMSLMDIAATLNIEYNTVWRYVRDGKLKGAQKIKGKWMIDETDFSAFLDGKDGDVRKKRSRQEVENDGGEWGADYAKQKARRVVPETVPETSPDEMLECAGCHGLVPASSESRPYDGPVECDGTPLYPDTLERYCPRCELWHPEWISTTEMAGVDESV